MTIAFGTQWLIGSQGDWMVGRRLKEIGSRSCLSHIPTYFLSFEDPIISSFKSRKVTEGFSMVWVWGGG